MKEGMFLLILGILLLFIANYIKPDNINAATEKTQFMEIELKNTFTFGRTRFGIYEIDNNKVIVSENGNVAVIK